jgi:hypothetical protein
VSGPRLGWASGRARPGADGRAGPGVAGSGAAGPGRERPGRAWRVLQRAEGEGMAKTRGADGVGGGSVQGLAGPHPDQAPHPPALHPCTYRTPRRRTAPTPPTTFDGAHGTSARHVRRLGRPGPVPACPVGRLACAGLPAPSQRARACARAAAMPWPMPPTRPAAVRPGRPIHPPHTHVHPGLPVRAAGRFRCRRPTRGGPPATGSSGPSRSPSHTPHSPPPPPGPPGPRGSRIAAPVPPTARLPSPPHPRLPYRRESPTPTFFPCPAQRHSPCLPHTPFPVSGPRRGPW